MSDVSNAAKVELRWLYDFKNGRFRDPGVTKVQRVHDVLVKLKQGGNQESPHGEEATNDGAVQSEPCSTTSEPAAQSCAAG